MYYGAKALNLGALQQFNTNYTSRVVLIFFAHCTLSPSISVQAVVRLVGMSENYAVKLGNSTNSKLMNAKLEQHEGNGTILNRIHKRVSSD